MLTPDAVDARILRELARDPRLSVLELAARVGVARNTAQARLERLTAAGVLGRNDRGVALRPLGFTVSAVVSIELQHSRIEEAVAALTDNPAVLEVEEVAGSAGDLLVRVAAKDTDDLQQVVHSLLTTPGVNRTTTQVVLAARVPYRVGPLLAALADDGGNPVG